ncbi:MAG: helix-turn-helix domain-containing protein [Thermoplasmatales archaeon]|jgi:putative transposase|nr:helix-turn-helix domain-containing protein [Candidatus Thermoplasmatota archaeon]MDA8055900.1 helix-turn-helix domain-containing protein [Thermoplasmatales archaeon]
MTRKRVWEVKKHITDSDLLNAIKRERTRARVVPRLMFIRLLYKGMSVPEASSEMKIQKRLGYIWLKRWNDSGMEGLVPSFSPGGPRKMSDEQLKELKDDLSSGSWTTEDAKKHIEEKFHVTYSSRQVSRILKGFNMHHSKPYPNDYRRPENAEDNLKKTDS